MQIEVRLVSRRPEPIAGSPAAVYVLTADDLRRAGATTLPDALRLVPAARCRLTLTARNLLARDRPEWARSATNVRATEVEPSAQWSTEIFF